MPSPRKKGDWPVVAALVVAVLLLAALGGYVGGYLALSYRVDVEGDERLWRAYDYKWQAAVFTPAAKVESLLIGRPVRAVWVNVLAG